jgi:hypothetical protein
VPDPENGNVPVVVRRRRRTHRHRRNRVIRRSIVAALIGVFAVGIATFALQYLSPSWFRARTVPPNFQQLELSRGRAVTLNEILSQAPPQRPVYPYSVVPGGVEDAKELKWVAEHDPIVAAHYAGFDYERARVVRLTLARTAYVSYRIGNHIYWTRRRIALHKGETLITDGRITARSRCANRVEEVPQQALSPVEPPAVKFDQPALPGTAVQFPPVPFQSALLNHPEAPGIGPVGPLSLYDPLGGGSFVPISPPPLPEGLCGPVKKKNGGIEIGKKKKTGPCSTGGGSMGSTPEPGAFLLFGSGLAAICIYGLTRRKLSRG